MFYVDDILLIANGVKMLGNIKAWLSTQFSINDMGDPLRFLGSRVIGIDLEGCWD